MSESIPERRKPTQRRNAGETKTRILAAAQQQFAMRGYGATRLRDIADTAGVAVSLLPLHFGSKAALFESALLEATSSSRVLDMPREGVGASLIDDIVTGGNLMLPSMLVLSIGDAEAREIATRVIRERGIKGMAQVLKTPRAEARALEFMMIATGFVLYARQLPLSDVTQRTKDKFADLLQSIIDEGGDHDSRLAHEQEPSQRQEPG